MLLLIAQSIWLIVPIKHFPLLSSTENFIVPYDFPEGIILTILYFCRNKYLSE